MTITTKIEGLDKLREALAKLPELVAKNVLPAALAAGATVVKDEAIIQAPEYHGKVSQGHPPPGTLKKSIIVVRAKTKKPLEVKYYVVVKRKLAPYWTYVEFGTSRMAANPFLRRAYGNGSKASEVVKTKLVAGITAEAAKLKVTK